MSASFPYFNIAQRTGTDYGKVLRYVALLEDSNSDNHWLSLNLPVGVRDEIRRAFKNERYRRAYSG